MQKLTVRGFEIYKGLLDPSAQAALVQDVRVIVSEGALFSPQTPFGKKISVRMTSAGAVGWYSDQKGYRYAAKRPSCASWPPIPDTIAEIWRQVSGVAQEPDCCLVNFYDAEVRLGMRQDKDEADYQWPVASVSLGDDALFWIGRQTCGGSTDTIWPAGRLASGDVVVMGGEARWLIVAWIGLGLAHQHCCLTTDVSI